MEVAPGRGRKPKIAAIVDATLQTKPEGMTHWSCRTMARSQGVSKVVNGPHQLQVAIPGSLLDNGVNRIDFNVPDAQSPNAQDAGC
jgi:hypothetical protein